MADMKDFDLDLNKTDEDNKNGEVQPRSSIPCSIIYSIVSISNASSQLTGDTGYTESKCH